MTQEEIRAIQIPPAPTGEIGEFALYLEAIRSAEFQLIRESTAQLSELNTLLRECRNFLKAAADGMKGNPFMKMFGGGK